MVHFFLIFSLKLLEKLGSIKNLTIQVLGRLTCFCNPAIVCQSCLPIALLRSDDICIYFTCVSYILYELYLFNYLPISSFSCVWVLNSWPHPSSMRIMILVSVGTSSGKELSKQDPGQYVCTGKN